MTVLNLILILKRERRKTNIRIQSKENISVKCFRELMLHIQILNIKLLFLSGKGSVIK